MNYFIKIYLLFIFFSVSLLAQEDNAILCSDGIDNDNNGQVDCEDLNCIALLNQVDVNGCDFCGDGLSFGDEVLNYVSGCSFLDSSIDGVLGVNDYISSTGDKPEFLFCLNHF